MPTDYDDVFTNESIPRENQTGYETVIIILPTLFYTLITVFIESYFKLPKNLCFFLELCLIIVPLVLGMTVLADVSSLLLFFLFSISTFLIMWFLRKTPEIKHNNTFKTDFITNNRSTVMILSVIAILAVDFNIFPSKFAKTNTFGYSLMDTGVGLYVFVNGVVSPESRGVRNPISTSLKGSVVLLALGIGRFVLLKLFNYHIPVSEYGVHWNFFITLGVTKLFTSFFLNIFNIKYIYINALLLLLAHELLLQCGVKSFVFNDTPRDNFIKANKEGLVSSTGLVALYLFAVYFGYVLNLKTNNQPVYKVTKKLVIGCLLFLSLSVLFQQFFGISRRLANSAYICWILFLGIFSQITFYFLQVTQKIIFRENSVYVPYIYNAVNYNGLVFFLLANFLTGLINIAVDTREIENIYALFIVLGYMVINCVVVSFCLQKVLNLSFKCLKD